MPKGVRLKVANKLKDASKEINEHFKDYTELDTQSVVVGLPIDRIHEPSGLPLAEVGAAHEFGVGKLPERSFLRGTLRNKREEIQQAMAILAQKAANGEDVNALMEQLALWAQGTVQEYIADGDTNFVPLAAPREDGSSNPLNDTGALRQGVIGVVVAE